MGCCTPGPDQERRRCPRCQGAEGHQLWHHPVPSQKAAQGTPLPSPCPVTSPLSRVPARLPPARGPAGPKPLTCAQHQQQQKGSERHGAHPRGGPGAFRGSAAAALPLAGDALRNPVIRNWRLGGGGSFIEHLEPVGRPHPTASPGEGGSVHPAWRREPGCRLADGAPMASSPQAASPTVPRLWGDTTGSVPVLRMDAAPGGGTGKGQQPGGPGQGWGAASSQPRGLSHSPQDLVGSMGGMDTPPRPSLGAGGPHPLAQPGVNHYRPATASPYAQINTGDAPPKCLRRWGPGAHKIPVPPSNLPARSQPHPRHEGPSGHKTPFPVRMRPPSPG